MRSQLLVSGTARWITGVTRVLIAMVASASALPAAGPSSARTFPSAHAAATALGAAYESGNPAAVAAVLGDPRHRLVSCGDPVIDRREREWFLSQFRKGYKVEPDGAERAILEIGSRDEPYPIPIVKSGGRWRFDPREGHEDLVSRRTGKTELTALDVLVECVKAQSEYFKKDRDGNGSLQYARRFRSTPGGRDGLFWEEAPGKIEGPLARFARSMVKEGYALPSPGGEMTYFGYTFRILLLQGPQAAGGARNFIVKGCMTGGFAIVAFPVRYGASGILTMMVGPNGEIYQKDLGAETAAVGRAMARFNPDKSWDKGSN